MICIGKGKTITEVAWQNLESMCVVKRKLFFTVWLILLVLVPAGQAQEVRYFYD